ncbi:MAG: hypothetical protein WC455_09335 [Dehalococcoidia bacterium]|jgi:hypothetical protein
MPEDIKGRLEYLRSQIRAECISYEEISELQSLAEHIDPDDVELAQWAGIPEFEEEVLTLTDVVTGINNGLRGKSGEQLADIWNAMYPEDKIVYNDSIARVPVGIIRSFWRRECDAQNTD